MLLSCRGSAWEGTADLERFTQTLPVIAHHVAPVPVDPDEALFAKPTDNGNSDVVHKGEDDAGSLHDQVLVVAMSSLSAAQRITFVSGLKNVEPGRFLDDIVKQGLERYAERPGDLRALALYWARYGKFGSLTDMSEFAISERLIEHDRMREAARLVTDVDARAGVERLAAAMTLAKTMELVLPTDEADTGDGVDPYAVLADWRPDDVTGLLLRGVFAPATFCRLRFYHPLRPGVSRRLLVPEARPAGFRALRNLPRGGLRDLDGSSISAARPPRGSQESTLVCATTC